MNAFIFTGQGCQKEGMGEDLYNKSSKARVLFEQANDILGERYSDIIFHGSEDQLIDTRNTQLSVLIYEIVVALSQDDVMADAMAGHSLGEYSALVVSHCISFEDCLMLIKARGQILYDSFKRKPGAMGAVIGLSDELVEKTLDELSQELQDKLYIANYNGPGQIVIAGSRQTVKSACRRFLELGAKRALLLPMNASGHNPGVFEEAEELSSFIEKVQFNQPDCPIFQCCDALPHTDPIEIKNNLKQHLTHPVLWTSITRNLVDYGITDFYEIGTDDTLQKIVRRMYPEKNVSSIWSVPSYKNIKPFKDSEL